MPNNQLARTNQMEWRLLNEPGIAGISIKVLRFDEASQRPPTFLLRFDPGATYPAHNHPGGEEAFVLEGDIHFGPDHLHQGDYLYTAPDNKHSVWTDKGCVVLFNVPQEVELLKK